MKFRYAFNAHKAHTMTI